MKTPRNPSINDAVMRIALIAIIMTLPFSFVRVPVAHTSLSLVSVLAVLWIIVTLPHIVRTRCYGKQEHLVWYCGAGFVAAFLPSLFFHPSAHAAGVVIEWMIVPLCTALCIVYGNHAPDRARATLHTALWLMIGVVTIDAFCTVAAGAMTFDRRVVGNFFTSPNQLAMLIAPTLILLLPTLRIADRYAIARRAVLCGAGAILVLTQSLASLLACAVAILLWYGMSHRIRWRSLCGAIAVCMLFCGFAVAIKAAHGPVFQAHGSLMARAVIWDVAISLIRDNPFVGHAIDAFQPAYLSAQPFFPPYHDWAVPTPHNIALTILFSGGIPALTAFVLLCARLIFLGVTQRATASLCAVVAVLLTGVGDTPIWSISGGYMFWIIASILLLPATKTAPRSA